MIENFLLRGSLDGKFQDHCCIVSFPSRNPNVLTIQPGRLWRLSFALATCSFGWYETCTPVSKSRSVSGKFVPS